MEVSVRDYFQGCEDDFTDNFPGGLANGSKIRHPHFCRDVRRPEKAADASTRSGRTACGRAKDGLRGRELVPADDGEDVGE